MRARGDGGQPRRVVRDGAGARAAVAGRGGDEDARVRGEHEVDLDRVDDERQRSGERQVDDVDAVGHGRVDGGGDVGGGRRSRCRPAGASRSCRSASRAAGAMPEAVPRLRPLIDRVRAVVAGGGARGVRAVAVAVARREELVGHRALLRPPASKHRAPMTLLLQVTRLATFGSVPGVADAVPLRRDGRGVRARLRQRREARALRPEAGVEDADDDALTGVGGARRTACSRRRSRRRGRGTPASRRCRSCRSRSSRRGARRSACSQRGWLRPRQLHGEAVERDVVRVHDRARSPMPACPSTSFRSAFR